jgi:hypothetical protein
MTTQAMSPEEGVTHKRGQRTGEEVEYNRPREDSPKADPNADERFTVIAMPDSTIEVKGD